MKQLPVSFRSQMKTLVILLATLAITESCFPSYKPGPAKCSCGVPLNKRRVIGGRPALTKEFPWQVALFEDSKAPMPFCGGSLLSSTTVLTAAHCITPTMRSITVGFPNGEISLDNATKIETSGIAVHPFWNPKSIDHDFAVLTLSTPIMFTDSTLPICLPDINNDYVGVVATGTGWGLTETYIPGTQQRLSPILMAVNMTTLSNEQCQEGLLMRYPDPFYTDVITPDMICAYEEGKTMCLGDSGGPFVTLSRDGSYYSQIGIVSWGDNCRSFSMFSRVTQQIYWIMKQITGDTCAPPVAS